MRLRRDTSPHGRDWEKTFALFAVVISAGLIAWAYATRPDPVEPSPLAETTTTSTQPAETTETTAAPAPDPSLPTCRELADQTGGDPVGTCRTATATLTLAEEGEPLRIDDVIAVVHESTLQQATTPSGLARARARVTVRMTLRNQTDEPLPADWDYIDLGVAGSTVAIDRAAARLPGGWNADEPIETGGQRTGSLRFETAGNTTRFLATQRRADLAIRVAPGRIGVVRLSVGDAS